MLKVLINEEEVVCDKDFIIKEEMLNTPSVILNNVYPKTWETDKDYVSRFYHPQDYSKCKIQDETYIPYEPGTTLTINGFTTLNDVDTSKIYEIQKLDGNTSQNGTPTPTSPIAVETVTGRQSINVLGKNVFDYTVSTFSTPSRVNMQFEDNVLTMTTTGTYTSNDLFFRTKIPDEYLEDGASYTLSSVNVSGVAQSLKLQLRNKDTSSAGKTASDTVVFDDTYSLFIVGNIFATSSSTSIPSGTTAIIKNIQVEKGTQLTTYEEYKSNTYEINLGKNLCDYQALNLITNSNGTTTIVNGYYNVIIDTLGVSSLYVSGDFTLLNSNTLRVGGYSVYPSTSATGTRYNITSNSAFNTNNHRYIMFCFLAKEGYTIDEIKNSFQIEKGTSPSDFSPYKEPIELCKIGTYQDFIRKGTGKNLLDFATKNIGATISMSIGSTGTLNSSSTGICTWIEMKNGESYTFSGDLSNLNSNVVRCLVTNDEVQIGTTCLRVDNFTSSNHTYTNSNNYKYLVLVFTGTTTVGSNWQLETGNTQTLYEPFGFKDKWYLYKAIGKVVLNGTESINYRSDGRFDIEIPSSSGNYAILGICDDYLYTNNWNTHTNTNGTFTIQNINWGANKCRMSFKNTNYSSLSDVRAGISSNNIKVYYQITNNIGVPTATEITDTELINQLESLVLLQGLNNISIISQNLSAPTTLLYNRVNEETIIDLLFCGVIKNSGNISLNPRYPHYSTLQILDFKTFLSEGETLDYVIANKTIIEAIQSVIDTISDYGFVLGNVNILNSTDIIGAYSTEDKTAYDVFNYIADITQSRWTTRVIDENTVAIDFYDPTLLPQGTSIEYNQNWFSQNLIDDMSYSYNAQDYRNKQVMTSSEVYGNINQTQSFVADGYATQFIVELPIARIQSITINGIEKTFATNVEKQIGYTADFYYTIGKNIFETGKNIAVGSVIAINYIPIVKGRQIITNNNEISRIETSTDRKGVVARYENRNDATTNTELRLIGESYIKYKGKPEILLTIKSRKNLWNVGNRVQFNSPLEALSLEYMVKEKDTNYIATIDTIFYTFILTSSFNSESAINYFDNQRSKNNGNIGEGEYIDRDIDFDTEEVSIIFYDTSLTETTIIGDSELQATLSSPLKE